MIMNNLNFKPYSTIPAFSNLFEVVFHISDSEGNLIRYEMYTKTRENAIATILEIKRIVDREIQLSDIQHKPLINDNNLEYVYEDEYIEFTFDYHLDYYDKKGIKYFVKLEKE